MIKNAMGKFYKTLFMGEEKEDSQLDSLPRNISLNILNGTLTKLGDQLASPGLVLTWLMETLGVSTSLIGGLVPIRKTFALLPQIIVSGQIRNTKIRKWFWASGAVMFGFFIALMVPVILLYGDNPNIGWMILGLLGLASLARGVSSISFKEVVGKTIPQGKRGRLLAIRATSGGSLALAAGIILRISMGSEAGLDPFLYLIAGGALLWVLGGIIVGFMTEEESSIEEVRNPIEEIQAGYQLLKSQDGLRQFIWVRSLFLVVQLSTPFYILFARQFVGVEFGNLAIFLIIVNLAKVLSSPIWGHFSDRSSKKGILAGGALATLVGVFALIINLLPSTYQNIYFFAGLLFLLGLAQSGIRLGRKTYFLDISPDNERPLFAAVSNMIIGSLTLLSSSLGIIVDVFSIEVLIVVITILSIFGIVVAYFLPEIKSS